jgi:uncharacterized protein
MVNTMQASSTQSIQKRAAWLRIMTQIHWISAAIGLVGMLFFAATGIMLNNAEHFENAMPVSTHHAATLPPALLATLNAQAANKALPDELKQWVSNNWEIRLSPKRTDWRDEEIFVDLPRPGVDAWLSVNRHSGAIEYQADDRGWVAFFNDLHKGKNAGPIWSGFITAFGIACLVFSISGLLILQVHAKSRWIVWPITGLGLIVPLVLLLLFVH